MTHAVDAKHADSRAVLGVEDEARQILPPPIRVSNEHSVVADKN